MTAYKAIQHCVCVAYLQDEYKVVDRFASLVQEVLRWAFVIFVELELLDDVRVSEDPQQNLLCDLERAEQAHLWVQDAGTQKNTSVLYFREQISFTNLCIKKGTNTFPLYLSAASQVSLMFVSDP